MIQYYSHKNRNKNSDNNVPARGYVPMVCTGERVYAGEKARTDTKIYTGEKVCADVSEPDDRDEKSGLFLGFPLRHWWRDAMPFIRSS